MAVTAIIDLERRFETWAMHEIYTGPNGTGKYVPNVDDFVLDWQTGTYRVISVDHGKTNLSYLSRVNLASLGGGLDENDLAVITGPGANSNSFRIYVDTSVTPHVMAIDSRVLWNGAENAYVKVFKGTDTSAATGKVISAIVTTTNKISSTNLPLTAVVVPNGTNVSIKTASTGWCSETVKDGDIVSVVTYTAAGVVTSIDKFVISTTNLVRSINQSEKYINDIELVTPFLSKTDAKLIECPINMITQSLNFAAKISYSDGTSVVTAIDGNKWALEGLDMYIATQIGQTARLMLSYRLGTGEHSIDASAELPDRRITRDYRIRTIDIDTYYSVKLFAVPVWNTSQRKYTLNWYLYNLDRKDIVDVTSKVEFSTISPKFVGDQYSTTQTMQIAFNMQNLGSSYSYFRHVQQFAITLTNPGSSIAANNYFEISYGKDLLYGNAVRAFFSSDTVNAGKMKLNLSCGYADSLTWITNVYRQLDPLYFNTTEVEAPVPTHARIIIGSGTSAWQKEIQIADIVSDITNINYAITQGALVRVELFQRDSSGTDNNLAVAPMVATAMA